MTGRGAVAYVVQIDAGEVTLNLLDMHRGQIASHSQGVSVVTEVGSLLALNSGSRLIVMRVQSISFAEPREVHQQLTMRIKADLEPLRHLKGVVVGFLSKHKEVISFSADSLCTPALGAEAFPLTSEEFSAISGRASAHSVPVTLGRNLRGEGPVIVGLSELIAKHVAVLGASGHGKSSFNAAVLQQLVRLPSAHIIVFDINGEYEQAITPYVPLGKLKITNVGAPQGYRIPYFALGRQGLLRLLLPSEKTQKPALTFAVEALNRVVGFGNQDGFGLVGEQAPSLFDDCRVGGADAANQAITRIRGRVAVPALAWPHMGALGALVAEGFSLAQTRNGWERNAFSYGNVSPLISRIRRLAEDERFRDVVNIDGGAPIGNAQLDLRAEASALVEEIFGSRQSNWNVHIVNLRHVAQDLMPLVLGSLLELYASELFKRGQGVSPETLLVLEEAHHYLKSVGSGDDAKDNALAYERLAKEGRKFGLALWVSTQRPSEVSSTVLSQCGTWACFRLTTEPDLSAVASATEWVDKREIRRIAGLAKRNAILFGSGISMPTMLEAKLAVPPPLSSDPNFESWARAND